MRNWYVVSSHPCKEYFAAGNLRNQGLEVFLPARKKSIRQRRGFRTIIAPLFPGYLFVSFELNVGTIRSVNGTRGVKHLISNGAVPSSLPPGFVESLISGLDEQGIVSQQPFLSPGKFVEFASGPFANQMGELIDMDDRGRVSVLMTMLSTKIHVKTTVSNLLPA